jgi:ABC-type branched-subunit amino acid transport system substrate-binding protein
MLAIRYAGVTLAALILAQGPVWAEDGVTDASVTFGMEAPSNSFSTDEENLGFRLAFREANARGGVHGRQIGWRDYVRNGAGNVESSVENARRLVSEDHVFALINFGGPAAIPLATFAREQKVPLLFPHTALVSSEGQRYLFTSFPRYGGEALVMFRYLSQERGLKRLAIVHDANVYGQFFLDRLKEYASRFGYTFAGNAPVATREPADLVPALQEFADKADAVVMALYPAQAKTLMAAKAELNWNGRMISVGPLTDEKYLALPEGRADGTLGFCYYPDPDIAKEAGVETYRQAMAKFHPGHPLNRYSLYGYVFGKLIVEGLERSDRNLTRERFIDAMETIAGWDSGGIMPKVTLSRTNHHAQTAGFICELANGRFKPLSGWISP